MGILYYLVNFTLFICVFITLFINFALVKRMINERKFYIEKLLIINKNVDYW